MEFRLRIHPEQGLVRIPRALRENFGTEWKLVPNTRAMVVFNESTDVSAVIASLDIIRQDLVNRQGEELTIMRRGRRGSAPGESTQASEEEEETGGTATSD